MRQICPAGSDDVINFKTMSVQLFEINIVSKAVGENYTKMIVSLEFKNFGFNLIWFPAKATPR